MIFFIVSFELCDIGITEGFLPADCALSGTDGLRMINRTACDNTLCTSQFGVCDGTSGTLCCCQDDIARVTSFNFTCEASNLRTIFQPEQCTCRPCGDLNVTLIFIISSGTDNSAIMGAEIVINGSSTLVTDDVGIANTNRPVSDEQVSVVITAGNHSSIMVTVEILPPGPTVINVVLSPVVRESLGSSSDNLTVPISDIATVDIPANSVVNTDGTPFTGNVTAEINIFTAGSDDSYSDSFPPEIVTEQVGGSTVFYQSLVLARTELLDDDGNSLDVDPDRPVTVVLTLDLFDQTDVTLLLLLFNDTTGLWTIGGNFTFTDDVSKKRQAQRQVSGAVTIPNARQLWSVSRPIQANDIVYLQVRVSEDTTGATIDVEFPNDSEFFRSSATTGDGSGPLGNSVCIEVRRGVGGNGAIQGRFNEATLTPSGVQPDRFFVEESTNTITFTGSTMGSAFYSTQTDCMDAADGLFVSFEPLVDPNPPIVIPPEEEDTGQGFWFIQVQVLSCFDSNSVTAASVNNRSQASVDTDTATSTSGAPIVPIPTDINPSMCTGRVTARTVCLQADTRVTIQAEQNTENAANGDLCYLREVSDQVNSDLLTANIFNVTLDLNNTLLQGNDPSQGIYFDATSREVALLRCTNNIGQPVPLGGSFVQFECFERKLTVS